MIVNATYVSIWDGDTEVETSCKFDKVSHKVTDIESIEDVEDLDFLDKEFIRLSDGTEIDSFITEDDRIVIDGEVIEDGDSETTYIFHNGEILEFDDEVLITDSHFDFDLERLSFKKTDNTKTLKLCIDGIEKDLLIRPFFDREKAHLTSSDKELFYIHINNKVTYLRDLKIV